MHQQDQVAAPIPIVPAFDSALWMWTVRDAGITNPTLLLAAYHHLARADPQTGLTRPTIDELASVLGVGRTQAQNLRRELVKVGLLELAEKGNGRGRASVYRLVFPHEKRLTSTAKKPLTASGEETAHSCLVSVSRFRGSFTGFPVQPVSRFSEHQASSSLPTGGEKEEPVESLGAHPLRGSPDPTEGSSFVATEPTGAGSVKGRLHLIEVDLGSDQSLPWTAPDFVEADADEPIERERSAPRESYNPLASLFEGWS